MSYNEQLASWTLDCRADMMVDQAKTGQKGHDPSRHTRCGGCTSQDRRLSPLVP
jgi:hypothetical protein